MKFCHDMQVTRLSWGSAARNNEEKALGDLKEPFQGFVGLCSFGSLPAGIKNLWKPPSFFVLFIDVCELKVNAVPLEGYPSHLVDWLPIAPLVRF